MSAILSLCGQYRYLLKRPSEIAAPEKGTAFFIMLNPSTADAENDDPTIRRCRGFARDWGCAGLVVANLYAYRSTDPSLLNQVSDPIGPENNAYLSSLASEFGDVICAWGNNAAIEREIEVADILKKAGARMWCLGTTKSGSPKHPLYLSRSTELIPWDRQ